MNIAGNFTEDTLKNIWKVNKENKQLKKQLEAYENMRKEAIEYVKEFTFEPLLVNEDRTLIMYNENLKNFENILNKVGEDNE